MKNKIKIFIASILLLCSTSVFAEDVDVVTLSTTAEGKTKDEAVTIALRSAVEQAFGTFISSKTEIVNDELIKDDIVSVSSGNIRKYNVLSETVLPEGMTVVTLKVDVSVTALTKFCESKGVEVEFKGGLFAANVKLQQLYEKNEIEALKNLRTIIDGMILNCFDYEIAVADPFAIEVHDYDDQGMLTINDLWAIDHIITIKANSNLKNVYAILINTLNGLSMTEDEIKNYEKIGKKVSDIWIVNTKENKRKNNKGEEIEQYIFEKLRQGQGKWGRGYEKNIIDDIKKDYDYRRKKQLENQSDIPYVRFVFRSATAMKVMSDIIFRIEMKKLACIIDNNLFTIKLSGNHVTKNDNDEDSRCYRIIADKNTVLLKIVQNKIIHQNRVSRIDRPSELLIFSPEFTTAYIIWRDILSLSEIEKIQKYTVKPYKGE
jgi:hypothetical protein